MRILFLYLTSFSTYGGIEKFNKALMKALSESVDIGFKALSSHDSICDIHYISNDNFRGFSGNKFAFSMQAVAEAAKYDKIILGHINLAPVGILIKRLYPNKKLIVVTHGIEVWNKLSGLKKKLIEVIDEVIAVSNFTKSKLITEHGVSPDQIKILYNTIDPYFDFKINKETIMSLKKKYQITNGVKIILTVCRISSAEKYKGYDKVIEALPEVLKKYPDTKYLLVGKYDEEERNGIVEKIQMLNLNSNVILAGFVPDNELPSHYNIADIFCMPSNGEGFGIVFLEAMACGLPIITGNNDGSKEILQKINFGISVDTDSIKELSSSIISMMDEKIVKEDVIKNVREIFGFENYKASLKRLLKLEQKEFIEA